MERVRFRRMNLRFLIFFYKDTKTNCLGIFGDYMSIKKLHLSTFILLNLPTFGMLPRLVKRTSPFAAQKRRNSYNNLSRFNVKTLNTNIIDKTDHTTPPNISKTRKYWQEKISDDANQLWNEIARSGCSTKDFLMMLKEVEQWTAEEKRGPSKNHQPMVTHKKEEVQSIIRSLGYDPNYITIWQNTSPYGSGASRHNEIILDLDDPYLKGTIGHELGHIIHTDSLVGEILRFAVDEKGLDESFLQRYNHFTEYRADAFAATRNIEYADDWISFIKKNIFFDYFVKDSKTHPSCESRLNLMFTIRDQMQQ